MSTSFEKLGLPANLISTNLVLNQLKNQNKEVRDHQLSGFEIEIGSDTPNTVQCYGDSWVSGAIGGPGLAVALAGPLGKIVLNNGQTGRALTAMLAASWSADGLIRNVDRALFPSIIVFGLNDYKDYNATPGSETFLYWANRYKEAAITSYVAATCPQKNNILAINIPKTGTWAPAGHELQRASSAGAFVEIVVSSRYICPTIFQYQDSCSNFTVSVDGVLYASSTAGWKQPDKPSFAGGDPDFYPRGCIVDTGFVGNKTIRISSTNVSVSAFLYFNYLAHWNGDEPELRNALIVKPMLYNRDPIPMDGFLSIGRIMEDAVAACRTSGLKASIYQFVAGGNAYMMSTDPLHPNPWGYNRLAQEIVDRAVRFVYK